jgi:hypothetical protein
MDLSPTIHATRHNDLRYELSCRRIGLSRVLPCLEQGQKREREPVWSDSVGIQDIVKVSLRDGVEVFLYKRSCSRFFRSIICR